MSLTLTDLAAKVNMETGNTTDRGTAHATGDATTTEYLIAPPFRSIVNDSDFIFLVDDVINQSGSMNYENGVYSDSQARPGANLKWEFNYVYWTNTQVFESVNAGIGMLFPFFYRTAVEDITTDGETKEYTITTPNVEELRWWMLDGALKKRTDVELDYDGEDTLVRFFSAPTAGTVSLSFVCRPTQLATNENVLDVPDRAEAPIVSYACYHLLNQKQAPRLRSDIALATVGGGNLSPRQMNDASNSFFLRYQMQMEHLRMRPWRTR
jgi:hypothetical protein